MPFEKTNLNFVQMSGNGYSGQTSGTFNVSGGPSGTSVLVENTDNKLSSNETFTFGGEDYTFKYNGYVQPQKTSTSTNGYGQTFSSTSNVGGLVRVLVAQSSNGSYVFIYPDGFYANSSQVTQLQLRNFSSSDYSLNGTAICFLAGTLITTIEGQQPVENLQTGDMVLTVDNGYKEIKWIGHKVLGGKNEHCSLRMRPIRIPVGALGEGLPEKTLLVSPQHRVLVKSSVAERVHGESEVLIAAKHLVDIDGIHVAEDLETVDYWHILFDGHELVYANGAPAESLLIGSEALRAIDDASLEEIRSIFPDLFGEGQVDVMTKGIRPMMSRKLSQRIVMRHIRNNKPLYKHA